MIRKLFHIFKTIFKKAIRKIRSKFILRIVKSHKGEIYVGGKTILSSNTILNKNPNFNGMTIKGTGEVYFGNNFHSGENCTIITDNHNYDYGSSIPYDDTYIVRNVVIEDNVWFGDLVVILGGVRIGEGAIIQAGAVVVKDIPACAIAGGNPAVVFKYRNKDHYYSLKNQQKFH
jgi:acetyltransferase-like isoleucine patch superfamily enzyme